MIFGNPGIYLEDTDDDCFAIMVNKLGKNFISINLCLEMQLIPEHLAYNEKGVIYQSLDNNSEIFSLQSEELFVLPDRELMIELIRKSFVILYRQEEIIDLGLYPKEKTERELDNYDSFFDNISTKENRENLWEIDSFEYTNRGYYVYIINHNKETKIAIIRKKPCEEYNRFFDEDKPCKPVFFDEKYWSIKVIVLPTTKIVFLKNEVLEYIKSM